VAVLARMGVVFHAISGGSLVTVADDQQYGGDGLYVEQGIERERIESNYKERDAWNVDKED